MRHELIPFDDPAPVPVAPAVDARPFSPPRDGRASWSRLLDAPLRYRWLVLGIILAAVAAAPLSTQLVPVQYGAKVTIWIDEPATEPGGPIRPDELLNSYAWVDLLLSFAVLDPVVREQRLFLHMAPPDSAVLRSFDVRDGYTPGRYRLTVGEGGSYVLQRQKAILERGVLGDSIGARLGFAWVVDPGTAGPGRRIEFTVTGIRDAARALADQLQPTLDLEQTFLAVQLEGSDPQRVAATLNSVASRYIEVAAGLKAARHNELGRILADQLGYAERNLREADMALESFRVNSVTLPADPGGATAAGMPASQDPVYMRYFALNLERDQLQHDREMIQRVLAPDGADSLRLEVLTTIPSAGRSMQLRQAIDDLTARRAELGAMQGRYTAEHRQVQRLSAEVATLEQSTIPQLARGTLNELAARTAQLDAQLASTAGQLRRIPSRAIQEAQLRRRADLAASLYVMLQQRYEETRLAAASSIPDVRILDAAVPPELPVNGKDRQRLMLMVILGSVVGAFGLSVLLDRVDQRVRYPEHVTGEMGLPILGVVPHLPGRSDRAAGLQLTEAFRQIRLGVLQSKVPGQPMLLAVTSPESGDGKSLVARNLAFAMGRQGLRTLLIDGDIRRGSLHRLLDARRVPGLSEYLSGSATTDDVTQATRHPGVAFIPSGLRLNEAPELLSPAAVREMLVGLAGDYDCVIIDTPPLGAGADAYVIAIAARQLMLVLRTGATDRAFASTKLELLDRLPVELIGAVLNDVPATRTYRSYGYLPDYATDGRESALQEISS